MKISPLTTISLLQCHYIDFPSILRPLKCEGSVNFFSSHDLCSEKVLQVSIRTVTKKSLFTSHFWRCRMRKRSDVFSFNYGGQREQKIALITHSPIFRNEPSLLFGVQTHFSNKTEKMLEGRFECYANMIKKKFWKFLFYFFKLRNNLETASVDRV